MLEYCLQTAHRALDIWHTAEVLAPELLSEYKPR